MVGKLVGLCCLDEHAIKKVSVNYAMQKIVPGSDHVVRIGLIVRRILLWFLLRVSTKATSGDRLNYGRGGSRECPPNTDGAFIIALTKISRIQGRGKGTNIVGLEVCNDIAEAR